ncbi:MAG: HAMP domain-containing sensor histidine kinase [bacterium]
MNNLSLYLPHEVRTPFVSILGYTSLILDGSVDFTKEELIEIIKDIHYSGKRLHKTMEKFLLFSYLTTLENDFAEKKKFDDGFVEIDETIISGIIAKHFQGLDFTNELIYEIQPATIIIKNDLFNFILEELVENASKFSSNNSEIKIISYIKNEYYILKITNTGRGMTNAQINCLGPCIQFEKQKHQQIGNGLGLAIIKKIMSIYKYRFSLDSVVNGETTITVSIKIKLLGH